MVPGLPVDHYHAFLDPLVVVIAGIGVGALWRLRPALASPRSIAAQVGPGLAVVVVGSLLTWNLLQQPPAVAADGGYPAAQRAATRIEKASADQPGVLYSLPDFKSGEAYKLSWDARRERLSSAGADGKTQVFKGR